MRSSIVSTIQGCYCDCVSFDIRLTWFKKYLLLFPNYTSAFISSFNCLCQRDQNFHTRSRNSPEKVVLKLFKLNKKPRKLLKYCCRLSGTY